MVRFPAGHLIMGILDEDLSGAPRKGFDALAKLLRRLRFKGDYALTISRVKGRVEIHCAFRRQADADLFAASVQAVALDTYPGWLSQRAFTLDVATAQRIARRRDDLMRAKGMRPWRR
jgi:hypothetical protein